jgi:hypothetical protein
MRDPALIIATGLAAAALLGLQHYAGLPYFKAALRRDMPLTARYVMGVLALYLPLAALFLVWGQMTAADAMWAMSAVLGLGGGSVFSYHWLDRLFERLSLRRDEQPE